MPTCKVCTEDYDFNEVKRQYGEVWWETTYMVKKNDEKPKRSEFRNLFKPEVFNLKPEDYTEEEFLDIVAEEAWNMDEWTPEGIMMLKHMILRLVVPKELEDFDLNTFHRFLAEKYKEIK